MTTKLNAHVTRETTLTVGGRAVHVTLVPGHPGNDGMIEFHLKGTQQRKALPLARVLRDAGWNADVPKQPTHAEQLKAVLDVIEGKVPA